MQRIGVFVCWCGTNIAGTVDVKKVAEALANEPGVVFSADYQYMCSQAGQDMIKDAVKEHRLTGIVVCSCSPRMHEATFRKTAAAAGLNPYMVEIANIREQCSWVHKEMPIGTEKAIILGKAAVAKVNLNTPLIPGQTPVTKRALVIGGGIAGIQTALDIADAGFPVDIVEKLPTIGGKMAQLDKTFPTLDCAACILTPKMVDAGQNENIRIFSYSEIEEVGGFVGNFTVKIKKKARYVKEDICTGCGLCTEKCPQKKVPNEFNLGMDNRRAVYIPFAQAVPKVATIDPNYCTMLKTGKCGVCAKVCTAGAIDYTQKDEVFTEKYGAIVAATGYNPISMDKFDEFAYSQSKDVITSLEFERLTNAAGPTAGKLLRPSDGKHPHTIVFVQCVGSRCSHDAEKGKEYCSKICCMYTAKHAMLVRDKYPDTEVYVFYIDVRTPGKAFDEFYRRAVEEYGVHYIKGMVGKVVPEGDTLKVTASDLLADKQLKIDADLVVLAAAIEPDKSARPLATMLTASMDTNDFFTEAHPKLRPVESPTAGVFPSGTCQPGVQLNGVGNTCDHCEICRSPHAAIMYGGNEHLIEYNYIHDMVLMSSDAGAIYSGYDWAGNGTVIRYNRLERIGANGFHPDGIYWDDGLSGQTAYGNLLIGIGKNGFLAGGGRENTICGNIIIDCRYPIQYDDRNRDGFVHDGWARSAVNTPGKGHWQRLKAVPYDSGIWKEKYPRLPKILFDFEKYDDPDFPINPTYSTVSGNVIIDRNGNLGLIAQSVYDYSTVENNPVYRSAEEAGLDPKTWTLAPDSPVFSQIPEFAPLPVAEMGRKK